MTAEPAPIVLVEDDPNIADLVDLYLRNDGYRVYQANSGEAGLELVARVKAILRRADGPTRDQPPAVLLAGEVEVDLGRREARVATTVVPLAAREFDLLAYLAENRGLALSRRQLLDGVWGVDWVGDERTVDVHVRQLRKKLGDGFPLSTVWGVGYRLD